MTIELTSQQLQILDRGEPGLPRVVDPRSNASYVLVSEAEYKTVRDVLEDERQQRSIRRVALRNAIGRMDELPWFGPAKSTWPISRKPGRTR